MRVSHYKLLMCGQPSFRAIRETLPEIEFQAGAERGFILDKETNLNRVKGRYVYTQVGKTTTLDPETLEKKEEETRSLTECRFEIDQQKGLVSVEQRRGELNALYEALDAIPSVNIAFEDLNLNLPPLLFEIQRAYKKNELKSVRIRDYLARENMLTNANFKILEAQEAEKIVEKFDDQIDSFTLTLKLPDGAVALTVTKKGTVRASDEAPDEVLLFVKELLPRFHEAEVETTQALDPVAAKRKRR